MEHVGTLSVEKPITLSTQHCTGVLEDWSTTLDAAEGASSTLPGTSTRTRACITPCVASRNTIETTLTHVN
jgi:hypothetical protein